MSYFLFLQCEVEVTYKPLKVGEQKAHLEAVTNELGTFPYEFQLTAHPPVPESYLEFTACLGQMDKQKTTIANDSAATTVSDFTFAVSDLGM